MALDRGRCETVEDVKEDVTAPEFAKWVHFYQTATPDDYYQAATNFWLYSIQFLFGGSPKLKPDNFLQRLPKAAIDYRPKTDDEPPKHKQPWEMTPEEQDAYREEMIRYTEKLFGAFAHEIR